jgi:hypothetical protein
MGESPPPEAEYWNASTTTSLCGVVLANVVNTNPKAEEVYL